MENKEWHALSRAQTISELRTDPEKGLKKEEVAQRLIAFGQNIIAEETKVSVWSIFWHQFQNVLIIILLLATGLSAAVGEWVDALLIFIIIIFCALLGFFQEYRAERALEALKKMLSPGCLVLRDGKEELVSTKEIVPGDILLVESGTKVAADGRVIESASLQCDEAALTGESQPVEKTIDSLPPETRVEDRRNMVYAGTIVTYGRGKVAVTATGQQTELGKIASEVASVEKEKTPLEKRTSEIGRWLGFLALGICIAIVAISLVRESLSGSVSWSFFLKMVIFAVALAVAAVPEALPAIVTGTLAIGMHQMAKRNALVRRMPAVETLGCTTVICTDKTGTLTKGEMTARRLFLNGINWEVSGTGFEPEGEIRPETERPQNDSALQIFLKACVLASDASLDEKEGRWIVKGDPTEGALVALAMKDRVIPLDLKIKNPRLEEVPFSSERKRMTTVVQLEDGRKMAFMKGAVEAVLPLCHFYQIEGEIKELSAEARQAIFMANETMANEALRVLAVAAKEIKGNESCSFPEVLESRMTFLGLVGLADPPRQEAKEAVAVCRQVGIKVVMITGDHKITALAIARELGIYQEGKLALTGEELDKLSEDELEKIVDQVTVYARVSPLDKIKIVRAWKKRGEIVAMTGDGVNDAPALKQADIGIAMGITGTDVAKEAADMILNDDNFATIVKAIERGRWIYDNIKKYLTFLLQCNLVEVIIIGGVVLTLGPEHLPLFPAAILFINLVTDGLPALALGIAPPDPDIMERPPRDPKEKVFSSDVLLFFALAILFWSPGFLWLYLRQLHDPLRARTDLFFLFILTELIVAFNFRSLRHSLWRLRPHRWLSLAVISQIILTFALSFIPVVREAFGIDIPKALDIEIILLFSLWATASIELTKLWIRRKISREKINFFKPETTA